MVASGLGVKLQLVEAAALAAIVGTGHVTE
jgi:hypothetical protein